MKTKKTANSVTRVSGQDLAQGSVCRGKDRHFSSKIKTIMESIIFILFGFLLGDSTEEQHYIYNYVKSDFFAQPAMAEIYRAALAIDAKKEKVNMLSVYNTLITDADSKALAKRMNEFRQYFVDRGDLHKDATDEEVKSQILLMLTSISTPSPTMTVSGVTKAFIVDYVKRAKQAIYAEFSAKAIESPNSDCSDELVNRLKPLDTLLQDNSWKNYVIDIDALARTPEDVALISWKGRDMFFRQNIYLISGMAGTMKSYLCLTIAAAAINGGVDADRTLSFSSIAVPLKVLYADTELANNTIRKRLKSLTAMTGEHLDPNRFMYLSLRKVPGTIHDKKRIFDETCHHFRPDIIILDSGRDLCLDFNDNRESDALVAHFLQISSDLDSVLISTSHQSLNTGNAKGHFGMRFNEKGGLELALTKEKDLDGYYIAVKFPKEREDQYTPFSYRFNNETLLLEEYAPTADRSEERRQIKTARSAIKKILMPGIAVSYSELIRLLCETAKGPKGLPISRDTAKNYISAATGTVIAKTADCKYCLINDDLTIGFPSEDEDMSEDIDFHQV